VTKDTLSFIYEIRSTSGDTAPVRFEVLLDGDTLNHRRVLREDPPAWAHLDHHQCRNCPLNIAEHPYCPVALSLVELVERFEQLVSFAEVEVTVKTRERSYHKITTMQQALSSLVGLHMATSGCPTLDLLKPMARFHQPFATREDTVFRAASTYLLRQYFRKKRGEPADMNLEGLRAAYQGIHNINVAMADRLRSVSRGDAHINAIVILDLFAQEVPMTIADNLRDIDYLFEDVSEDDGDQRDAAAT